VLEAALLETDEIKAIDPPYNVQLRAGERKAWFASRDLRHAQAAPDLIHRIGPLPSERALLGLFALRELAAGAEASPALSAMALAVPQNFLPEPQLFAEGYAVFAAEHLQQRPEPTPARRVAAASHALWVARGRTEIESNADEADPDLWDLARVRRRLERALVQTGLLVRRARFLRLLAEADVVYREVAMPRPRALVLSGGQIKERHDLTQIDDIHEWPSRDRSSAAFDAVVYDRLRVLATELARVHAEHGELALRFARHLYRGDRLIQLLRAV
jgi:DNA polymerase-3 subunit epsilon